MFQGNAKMNPSYDNSSKPNNKISKFLQSYAMRDMFPEHNSRATDPNIHYSSIVNNQNCNLW